MRMLVKMVMEIRISYKVRNSMNTRPMTVTLSCTALLGARLLYLKLDDFTHCSE